MIISTASRTVFVAPTSGRARLTKPAAYREEARARFEATCDCVDTGGPCRYHDRERWVKDPLDYSLNGRIIALYACVLAASDGVHLPKPPPLWRRPPEPPDDGLPF